MLFAQNGHNLPAPGGLVIERRMGIRSPDDAVPCRGSTTRVI